MYVSVLYSVESALELRHVMLSFLNDDIMGINRSVWFNVCNLLLQQSF